MDRSHRGFTLLELVVVIAIITALAGIIVRILPDMMKKTNDARMVANLHEADSLVQTYHGANKGSYPNGFDSLLTAGSLFPYLPSDGTNFVGGYLEAKALTATQVTRLKSAGITTVYDMAEKSAWRGAVNATYLVGSVARALAADGKAVFLAKSGSSYATLAGSVLKLDDTRDYVVFGLGHNCDLIGPGGMIKDCPVIIHNGGCTDPKTVYCGVVAIFDLCTSDTYRGAYAKFVGCVAFASDGFRTGEQIATNPD